MYILTWHILIHCMLGQELDLTNSSFRINESNPVLEICIKKPLGILSIGDTLKLNDFPVIIGLNYVVAGSFLIPKNADTQVSKLKSLGFSKSFRYNFPDSEYYSAVVDTFRLDSLLIPVGLIELTDKLRKSKIAYFIKN